MLIFLSGNDSYLAKQTIDEIKQKYLAKNDGAELIEINGDETLRANFADLQAVPLFATSRLVIIKEAAKLLAAAQDDLASFLGNLPPTTVVVVWDGGMLRPNLTRLLGKAGKIISVASLEGPALKRWVTKEAKNLNCQVDEATLNLLIDNCGNDLWAIGQELRVLSLGGELSEARVKKGGMDFAYFRLCRSSNWSGIQRQLSEDLKNGRPIELIMGELSAAVRKEVRNKEEKARLTDILMDFDVALKTGLLDEPAVVAMLISALPNSSIKKVEWEEAWQDLAS